MEQEIIYLQDSHCYKRFFPFTHTLHTAQLLAGTFTMQQRWEKITAKKVVCIRDERPIDGVTIFSADAFPDGYDITMEHAYDLVLKNAAILKIDAVYKKTELPNTVVDNNQQIGVYGVHAGKNVIANFCMFNTVDGPILIEDDVHIMEGSILRGPLIIKRNAVIKAGAKIYGGTTIGKKCVVGGEVKNSIFLYASNKAHDGYIGDSYIGAWCNLGAGTSNSNVKNTAGIIYAYSEFYGESIPIGNKAGILLGNYSRTAINTSLNSGSVIGICCNVFGNGLTPKHLTNFSWGYDIANDDYEDIYTFDEAIAHIKNWVALKQDVLHEETIQQLKKVFDKRI
jgi:UDP-N-acetylglucosamine diphosphorylase / glucose-1-phosphate thymidylyltransferase / UDP-N-acetylgalactosamine diphosphorylase / glucosamine-1-phosphate N-acetyltransferase / galactosamine-1-phosphate N-acetyltransferase